MTEKTKAKKGSAVGLLILGAALTVLGSLVTLHFQQKSETHTEKVIELKKYGEIVSRGDVLLRKAEILEIEMRGMSPSTFSTDDATKIYKRYGELLEQEASWRGDLRQEETVIFGVFHGMSPDPLEIAPPPERTAEHEPADAWRNMHEDTIWLEAAFQSVLTRARGFSVSLANDVQEPK
jgi:hypothetical protein